ncbi:MAG: IPT/TIG domain-containing protein [Bryobacteraceae bacterium]
MGKLRLVLSILITTSFANANVLTCTPSAVTPSLHAEGLAERLGDIVLSCVDGTPGPVVGNLNVFLNVNVTNKLTAQGNADAVLTVDAGAGPVSAGVPPTLLSANQIAFNGLNLTVPASGKLDLRITNLRGAVAQLPSAAFGQAVHAQISFNGAGLGLTSNDLIVGFPQRSILASVLTNVVATQQGSPLPDNPTFSSLLAAGTRFASARITEDGVSALQPRGPLADNGVRIISRYSNLPAGARLFVPDAIAGSNAVKPTAGGDFGVAASGGQYAAGGNGSLLLIRVNGADANGAGGNLVFTPAPGTNSFDTVGELAISNGTAQAVYEVMDANSNLRESAQFPTFLGVAPITDARISAISQQIFLGPVSTVVTASASAPVPRFTLTTPASDCTLQGDCNGSFLPKLGVDPEPLTFTVTAGGGFQIRYVRIFNSGGNLLVWNAVVAYKNGADWLRVSPSSGIDDARIRVDVLPNNLAPGAYDATLTIDAGPQSGSIALPIHVQVNAAPPSTAPAPVITSVINAATFAAGPLVRGSFGTIKGSNLAGKATTVTFDNVSANIVYTSASQLNVLVPSQLSSRNSTQLVVTVDGVASAPQTVALADVSPGIFNPGILNQDNTINSPSNPALVGSVIQIFATGVLPPEGGIVDVKIHDQANLQPSFAATAPGVPGLQQINVRVPAGLPGITTEVVVCGTSTGTRVCSPPAAITLRQ